MNDGAAPGSFADQALAGVLLVLPSIALVPLAITVARRVFPSEGDHAARWQGAHVVLVVLVYVAASLAAAAVIGLAGGGDPGALGGIALAAVLDVAAAAAILAVARTVDPAGWRSLGLPRGGHGRAAAVGLVGYGAALPGLFGVMLAWPATLQAAGVDVEPQAVLLDALRLGGVRLAVFAVFAVGIVPALEELCFRAFLQPFLVRRLGGAAGVVLTSGIFAALHGASAFLPIFALSLVLGSVMLRTRRLSAVSLVHALHNGVILSLVLLVPGARETLLEGAFVPGWIAP